MNNRIFDSKLLFITLSLSSLIQPGADKNPHFIYRHTDLYFKAKIDILVGFFSTIHLIHSVIIGNYVVISISFTFVKKNSNSKKNNSIKRETLYANNLAVFSGSVVYVGKFDCRGGSQFVVWLIKNRSSFGDFIVFQQREKQRKSASDSLLALYLYFPVQ